MTEKKKYPKYTKHPVIQYIKQTVCYSISEEVKVPED